MSGTAPNIVFVLSDDQGPWALGCAGNEDIVTPRLDGLAEAGTRLENFFCVSPVCSPARASLLTGQIPSRHGVHDYLDGQHSGPGAVDFLAGQDTFTQALAESGYRLGLSGKWHLGANDLPRRGFADWYALDGGGSPYTAWTAHRNGVREEGNGYLTDAITDEALAILDRSAAEREQTGTPFFLAVHYTAPHKPWAGQHPPEFEALYEDCEFASCPQEPLHPWVPLKDGVPIGGEPDARAALVGYFASVSAMDAGIGRILDRLAEHGIAEDTIVVFSSDNGFNAGHHGIWGKGNGTYPQNMYDSSVKVPFILAWPGHAPAGQVRHELFSAYDVASTLLDLVGLDGRRFEDGPGLSFAGLLAPPTAGAPAPGGAHDAAPAPSARSEAAVVVYDEYGPVRMIRTPDWKYVHRYPDGPHELYHLAADPGERENLADDPGQRERIGELRARLERWFTDHVDPRMDGRDLPVTGAGQIAPLVQHGGADTAAGCFGTPAWERVAGESVPAAGSGK